MHISKIIVKCLESHNYAGLKIRDGTCDWTKKNLSVWLWGEIATRMKTKQVSNIYTCI